MPYRSVMVFVEPSQSEGLVRYAAALASGAGARLIGFAAQSLRPPPVDPLGGYVAAELITAEEQEIEKDLKGAAAHFAEVTRGLSVAAEWRAVLAQPGLVFAEAARAADVLVLSRESALAPGDLARYPSPADVVMQAGRPVIVLPPGATPPEPKRVLVAWKDTREARRAIADALPLLAGASEVKLLACIDDEAETARATASLRDVAGWLSNHGVTASPDIRPVGDRSAEAAIIEATIEFGDLVVAGAYGHSRLTEWAFGGVTRELIDSAPIPCLLSH